MSYGPPFSVPTNAYATLFSS